MFTRAKLAEAVHAELYMEAYNNIDAPDDDTYFLCPVCGYIEKGIDAPDDDTYFLCPVCGYIEKGNDFEKCPICFCPKDKFRAF